MAGHELVVTPAIRRWQVLGWQQQTGRISEYWRMIIDRDPFLTDVVMVIEMVFGGHTGGATVVRIASLPVDSVSELTGLRHDAQAKLLEEPELSQTYQLGSGSSAARAMGIDIDPVLVHPALLVSRGVPLAGVAEISLEPLGGSNHDRRFVLVRGDIDGSVQFGTTDGTDREVMSLEIVDPRTSVATKLPTWVMDANRFATAGVHKSAVGQRVPLVVNSYEGIPAQRLTSVAVGANQFLFAAGHGWAVDTTDGVKVNGTAYTSADVTYAWVMSEGTDDYGDPYSYIDFTAVGTAWSDTDAVHVTAARAADGLGVIQVIERVLHRHSALGIDGTNASLIAESTAKLPFRIQPAVLVNGASGGSAANVLEWIEGGLLKQFPMVSMVWEGGRYGPIVTDFRSRPMARWTAGSMPLLDRASLVEETSKDQIRNSFVLRYDYDPVEQIYRKVMLRDHTTSDVCAYSLQVFGEMHAEPIEAPYIREDSHAAYVVDWQVAHRALPSYGVDYDAAPSVALEYRRGDTIELTDPGLLFSDVPATIERITYRRSKAVIRFRVWARVLDFGAETRSV